MYDNDLSDSPELRELRDAVSGVATPGPPPLEPIMARGRARRRRRLTHITRLSVGGVAAATALALGVSGAFSPAAKLGTIRTAAYTLHHNSNGTDTLTLNPGELLNPSQLQSDFAQYGIPAKVTSGSYCTSDPAPSRLLPGRHLPARHLPEGRGYARHHYDRPVADTVGHRAQRRLLPRHLWPDSRRAAGQHVPHQHQTPTAAPAPRRT